MDKIYNQIISKKTCMDVQLIKNFVYFNGQKTNFNVN